MLPAPDEVPLASLRFHTAAMSDAERFESWRQRVVGLYDVLPSPEAGVAPFHMDTTSWHLGQLIAGTAEFGPRDQARTARQIRADQVDHYRLILLTAGALRIDADGRRVQLGVGQVVVTDMARPEFYSADDGANVSLFVPRDVLDEVLQRPLDLHGLVPKGAMAALLADHLQSLVRHLPGMTISGAALMSKATLSLIAACLLPSAALLQQARPAVESTLLRKACRHIEDHLPDAALSPQSIGAAMQLSRAALYRLFEPLGGVAAYIKERRLQRIHGLLSRPAERRYLGQIAEDHGFTDAAQFSRAFRQQFGYSPSEVRVNGLPSPKAPQAAGESFDDWLRALR